MLGSRYSREWLWDTLHFSEHMAKWVCSAVPGNAAYWFVVMGTLPMHSQSHPNPGHFLLIENISNPNDRMRNDPNAFFILWRKIKRKKIIIYCCVHLALPIFPNLFPLTSNLSLPHESGSPLFWVIHLSCSSPLQLLIRLPFLSFIPSAVQLACPLPTAAECPTLVFSLQPKNSL